MQYAVEGSHAVSSQHLGALTNPDTGQLQFPAGWGKNMIADQRMIQADQSALWGAYGRLQAGGDPPQSDPHLMSALLSRAALPQQTNQRPAQAEILSHVGGGLTLADAQWMSGLSRPQTPQQQASTRDLVSTMASARDTTGYGPAGDAAYGRFVNWFLPAYRNGLSAETTHADLMHPETGLPAKVADFAPTGDDAVAHIQAAVDRKQRPSLGQIFAGNAPAPPSLPNKPFPEGPYDKGDNRYTEKGGPVKIPGGGSRPF
jgi:hypothetical protein